MFDNLSDKFSEIFKKLRGETRLTESNIAEAMREIRMALLDADVNVDVAREFVEKVRVDCLGEAVLKSITPGQQVVKVVNDRLIELLGGEAGQLDLTSNPTVIMLVGLHGSGKTTTAAKLARYLTDKLKKSVLLTACDVYRPAAIDQLEILGKELNIEVFSKRGEMNVPAIAAEAVSRAKFAHHDVVILDTAGRLEIDDAMVQELIRLRQSVRADEVLLVADAALGQEAVHVADTFHKALNLTGFILTKLDGDARGGAALSIRQVTQCPVKFVGMGEKTDDLDVFHPDRMASRILGMGDVVSLVEKAAADLDHEEAEKLAKKLRKNEFDFNDFLSQIKQFERLGGLEGLLKFLPGGKQMQEALAMVDPREFKRLEAMVLSMTPGERANPDSIDFARRKRIARGCGLPLEKIAGFIRQFNQMRKMMKKGGLMKALMGGGGGAPTEIPAGGMGGGFNPFGGSQQTVSKKEQEKKKRLAKLKKKEKQKQRRKK
ncbi:MAG: signal recognition particle protein [Lentisphaerae bacterium]|nr:signal recognition particle protein [Lentisphaerota bacterium]